MNIHHKVDDRLAKALSIPCIGIVLPNLTGLIVNSRYGTPFLFVQYSYFILLVYLLWEGNILFIVMIKNRVNFDKIPYRNYVFVIIICNLIYAGVVAGCLFTLWTVLFQENNTTQKILINSVMLLACVATFITIIYENYLLNRKKLNALSKVERMSLAKAQAELTV